MTRIKINFIFNVILSISGLIIPIITFPYITRAIGPEGYGIVSFVNSFIQYFIIIATLGIPIYGTREIAKVKDDIQKRSKLFFEIILIHSFLTLIVISIYTIAIFSINKCIEHKIFFIWGICSIATFPYNIQWFFSGMEEFKFITIRSLILNIIQIIFLFIFVKNPSDTFIYFLLPIIFGFLTIFVNLKHAKTFLIFKFGNLNFKKHFWPLLFLFLFNFIVTIYELLDTVILGFLTDYKSVSYYTAAMRLTKAPLTIFASLTAVLIPRLSFSHNQNDTFEVKRLIEKSLSFIFLLAIPIVIGELALAPEIILVLAGTSFSPAILTFRLLCPLTIVIGISSVFGIQILNPLNKDRQLLVASIFAAIVYLGLSFLIIPIWKNNGAAITNLIAESVAALVTFYFAKKYLDFNIPIRLVFNNLAVSLPFFLFAIIFRHIFNQALVVLMSTVTISILYYMSVHLFILKNEFILEFSDYIKNYFWKK